MNQLKPEPKTVQMLGQVYEDSPVPIADAVSTTRTVVNISFFSTPGEVAAEVLTGTDHAYRGGLAIRLSVPNGDSLQIPCAVNTPQGIEIHLAGDVESAAVLRALRAVLAAVP